MKTIAQPLQAQDTGVIVYPLRVCYMLVIAHQIKMTLIRVVMRE